MKVAKKVLKIPLRLSISVLFLGIIFKIQHNSAYADAIVVTALVAIAVLYTIRFWKKYKKIFLDYVKLVLVVFWCINVVFSVFHLAYGFVFETITFITFLTWAVLEGTAYFAEDGENSRVSLQHILWNSLMVLGSLAIVTGVLSKIIHWVYADSLLYVGFLSVAIYILRDTFTELLQNKDQ